MTEVVETYACKFENQCGKFDSAKFACLHGGGVSCRNWRKFTDETICYDEKLRQRVQSKLSGVFAP